MNRQEVSRNRRGGVWWGLLIGIVATVAVLGIGAAVMYLAMGRCPLCGEMMTSVFQAGLAFADESAGVHLVAIARNGRSFPRLLHKASCGSKTA